VSFINLKFVLFCLDILTIHNFKVVHVHNCLLNHLACIHT
jgi:hypothetical protein